MTDDCKGFIIVTFAALVAYVVLVDETAVVVPHCELLIVLGFDAVSVSICCICSCFTCCCCISSCRHLVVVAVLSTLDGIEVHVDIVLLVLPVLQEVLTELVHFTDQLWSSQLSALRCPLSFVYWLTQILR